MNGPIKESVLELMNAGLWNAYNPKLRQVLSDDEWIELYRISKEQTILGIVYDGFKKLPLEKQPSRQIQIKWALSLEKIERQNDIQLDVLDSLQAFFMQEKGHPFILLKGQSIAKYYPNRFHRACGDIDLWFGNKENGETANKYIEECGIQVIRRYDDADYFINNLEIEHHYRLIELHNPLIQKDLEKWEYETFKACQNVLSPTANLFLQVSHILKHQLNTGIGLRQICDLCICLRAFEYDHTEFTRLTKKYGCYRWTQLLFALLIKYFHLEQGCLPFKAKGNPDHLMKEILQTGNFGHYDNRFGKMPSSNFKRKIYSLHRILYKAKLFFWYAPSESFWWIYDLSIKRIKELIK